MKIFITALAIIFTIATFMSSLMLYHLITLFSAIILFFLVRYLSLYTDMSNTRIKFFGCFVWGLFSVLFIIVACVDILSPLFSKYI
jgi:hypothetical protein